MINKLIAIIILILSVPILILVAIFILIVDGRPVIFRQKRVGINYTFFYLYKFRTMKKETPNIATHLLVNPEQYELKSGRLLHKLSLNELPNLWNVVLGDIVFVGPRPALYNQDDLMAQRLAVGVEKLKPGITGWAQVNGRDEISMEEKVALDEEYLYNKSIWLDLKIILLTFNVVLGILPSKLIRSGRKV